MRLAQVGMPLARSVPDTPRDGGGMSNAMHPGLRAEVLHRYRLSGAAQPLIGGGDECELWWVDASPPLVVRLSPSWRSVAGLAWTHRAARVLAAGNAEVICPLPGLDGTTIFAWRDRPVSVWPYVQGQTLDRDDVNQRTAAAGLLARLHRSALATSEPNDAPPAPIPPDARVQVLPDAELDAELTGWHDGAARAEPQAVVHGDFYRRNILCRAGKIVGLIDWDDAHVDLLPPSSHGRRGSWRRRRPATRYLSTGRPASSPRTKLPAGR